MILGCIGDDFTGSSDLGLTLAAGGMRTVQYVGIPDKPAGPNVEAGIVALKSRSIPVPDAVSQSLAALDWLRDQGCRKFLFKYCSTFDSTPKGNIGPVAEALADALGHDGPVIFCPAFPETGRTVYQGHLFVRDRLLSESGLENHPLTPMNDPDLRRWLSHQTRRGVGHVSLATVEAGTKAVRMALEAEAREDRPLVICDALTEAHLVTLGRAAFDLPVLTGASGIALGLPKNLTGRAGIAAGWRGEDGPVAALSGSCSAATRGQIRRHEEAGEPSLHVTASEVISGQHVGKLLRWTFDRAAEGRLPLIYTSATPEEVSEVQSRYGREAAAGAIDAFFGGLARDLAQGGIARLVVAGGETSGAAVGALGAVALEVGPAIAPGVPALRVIGLNLVLALKSGNFGGPGFFAEAAEMLKGGV